MWNLGQSLPNSLIDTIKFSRINANKLIVGNLMTCPALINVSMEIMKWYFAHDDLSRK